jgi:hypothetical protein
VNVSIAGLVRDTSPLDKAGHSSSADALENNLVDDEQMGQVQVWHHA